MVRNTGPNKKQCGFVLYLALAIFSLRILWCCVNCLVVFVKAVKEVIHIQVGRCGNAIGIKSTVLNLVANKAIISLCSRSDICFKEMNVLHFSMFQKLFS
uniref:Secreted protein n=1 Tax=Elaeophora elaphi TaxID=1147741 RepID=A0A158Q706_9BILA